MSMNYFETKINEEEIKLQLKVNKDKINALKLLLENKSVVDIENDLELLSNISEIVFDKKREFIIYEPEFILNRAQQRIRKIFSKIGKRKVKEYLDIGCGCGQYPKAMHNLYGIKSVGIDIYKNNMWETFLKGSNGKLSYEVQDITYKKEGFEQYDLVSSFCAFEHFQHPRLMLESMGKFVKKNGYLYILFAPIYNSTDGYHMYRHIQAPWYHLLFSEETCKNFYKKNNIEKESLANNFNKTSAFDFFLIFTGFKGLKLKAINPIWNFRHYWFYHSFPELFKEYNTNELFINGFEVVYQNKSDKIVLFERLKAIIYLILKLL